ncbi:hypothetical protein J2T19_000892 [Paenibacillus tundrae]|uniref:Uncharacterized protein n=1 Tax=Paenibacillus tundrae TaxID=528187 RepID=A0ABT9W874_9BACL|nr:hypothetical protein [Paenibacillus tundrae]
MPIEGDFSCFHKDLYGDESTPGALLLTAISGVPCTADMDDKLSFQIGMYHAKLHEVNMQQYGYHTTEGFKPLEQNDWRLHIQHNFDKWKEPCKEILVQALYEKCIRYFDHAFSALPEPMGLLLFTWTLDQEIY